MINRKDRPKPNRLEPMDHDDQWRPFRLILGVFMIIVGLYMVALFSH